MVTESSKMAAVLLRRTKLAKFNVRSLSFNSFGLQLAIINRLEEAGIVKPTEIQEKVCLIPDGS